MVCASQRTKFTLNNCVCTLFSSIFGTSYVLFLLFFKDDSDAVAERCLDRFHHWAGRSKLAIGYLLHANRRGGLKSDQFIAK